MFKRIFSKDIGLDLGTTNTRVYVRGRGLVINEATIMAVNTRNDQVVAIGNNALRMLGKAPGHISVIKPLINGVISDFEIT